MNNLGFRALKGQQTVSFQTVWPLAYIPLYLTTISSSENSTAHSDLLSETLF